MAIPPQARVSLSMFLLFARRSPTMPFLANVSSDNGSIPCLKKKKKKLLSQPENGFNWYYLTNLFNKIAHKINNLWLTPSFPDFMCNSPYCLLYNSCDVTLENLVLDQEIILLLTFFFILITWTLDFVLILWGEILS